MHKEASQKTKMMGHAKKKIRYRNLDHTNTPEAV